MSYPQKMRTDRRGTLLYRELLFIQKGKCFNCQISEWELKKSLQCHRIIKGKDGGLYTLENTVLLCQKCHIKVDKNIIQLRKTC